MSNGKLRIMIADQDATRGELLARALTGAGYAVVELASADAYLPARVTEAQPDVILIETDSPSRDTLEQLTLIHRDYPRPVVMFANDEARETIEAAVRAGVSAYITNGVSGARVQPIIDVAIAHFRRHQGMRRELERTRSSLAERKTIDRAKGLLMQRRGCSEAEAFALLRKAAMDHKKRVGQVAEEVIQAAGLADPPRPRRSIAS